MKRLTIVVPYRDRAKHLQQFVSHMRSYFSRDKLDKDIPYRVLIVEQENGLPFNRGMLLNVGFLLGAEDSDYTCFHDVDYLPVWADYSWAEGPTPILWYGAEQRPIAPGRSNLTITHNLDAYFSGVLLVPNDQFKKVNGYANDYWGWGFEDIDLRARFIAAQIPQGRRKGTFVALDHDNQGFKIDGTPSPIMLANKRLSEQRLSMPSTLSDDGLTRAGFKILERNSIPDLNPERPASWEVVKVRLEGGPSAAQLEALAQKNTASEVMV
jgi:glycosyl transferase family 7 (putative galactosyltransferase)